MIPRWLASIVPSLVKAGKCSEVLKSYSVLRSEKKNNYFISLIFIFIFNKDNEETKSFVEEFTQHLQNNFHLTQITWNPLASLHNSAIMNNQNSSSNPFVFLHLPFDDIDDEKNSFLALAFNHMKASQTTLVEINR